MIADPAPAPLTERFAAQSVIEELLAVQALVPPRSRLRRIFGASPLNDASWPWYKGALGEITVGRILAGLGPEWLVLHAVPVGSGWSDIDHVLVGPAGVFTLNTKNHADQSIWVAGQTLMVSGKKQRHLYNAAHEAARASKLLSTATGAAVEVTGVVVIVEPRRLTVREKPRQVMVLSERQLLGFLQRRHPVLNAEQVHGIAAAAMQPRTWHTKPTARGNPDELKRNFAALRDLVDQARRRRVAWALGVPAVGVLMLTGGQWAAAIMHALTNR
ncbi:hypothetical protein GCM10009825_33390 [Arthrobacter humicola]|uniref:NERD domain-containing protein n=1 Tax=Arthrobacter humicola TaxID=409291 RepID=A0ABP5LD17_9MICC